MIRIKLCSVKVRGFLAGKITLLPGKILGVEHKILRVFHKFNYRGPDWKGHLKEQNQLRESIRLERGRKQN